MRRAWLALLPLIAVGAAGIPSVWAEVDAQTDPAAKACLAQAEERQATADRFIAQMEACETDMAGRPPPSWDLVKAHIPTADLQRSAAAAIDAASTHCAEAALTRLKKHPQVYRFAPASHLRRMASKDTRIVENSFSTSLRCQVATSSWMSR